MPMRLRNRRAVVCALLYCCSRDTNSTANDSDESCDGSSCTTSTSTDVGRDVDSGHKAQSNAGSGGSASAVTDGGVANSGGKGGRSGEADGGTVADSGGAPVDPNPADSGHTDGSTVDTPAEEDAGTDPTQNDAAVAQPDASTTPATAACGVLDLLFVIDNSGSMRPEQLALRDQFPRLVNALTTGRTVRGSSFPAVKDMHLGVVSADMGLAGIANTFPGCNTQRHINGGDDGVLQHPSNTGPGCAASYPPFLSFVQGTDDPGQVSADFGCISNLGTSGCGFEQQLEAGLKALWPKNYVDADGNAYLPENNPILFLSTTAEGRYGHGDVPPEQGGNAGFLRGDTAAGGSHVAIIVVTDEEDCSSRDTGHFISTNDPANPLSRQGPNLRCFYNKQNLFDPQRYINGYRALRPGKPELVMYGAIVGVPTDLVSEMARTNVRWDDQASRDAYYDSVLNDPRMQEVPENENVPALANVRASCSWTDTTGASNTAFAPRRIVEVAKGIGTNAVIQSICQSDFSEPTDAIVELIGSRLAANCSP